MSEARWSDGTHGGAAAAAAASKQIEKENPGTTPEREARIAELRQQYQQGLYRVDAATLSARIIDEHLKR